MKKSNSIKLNIFGLPVIHSIGDLSEATHISTNTLYHLSRNADKFYFSYTIPKKSGSLRTISQPSKKLKAIQAWILVEILYKLKVSEPCKGFERGSSTADNAKVHVGANALLSLDLEDFFSNIEREKVYTIFKSIGYNPEVATIFTNFCTYKGSLPQGSPCSPKLSNLCCWSLDMRINGYVGRRGIIYSRYADDISLSGSSRLSVAKVLPIVNAIIIDENFALNKNKTRIAGTSRAKKVTGLILSDKGYGVGRTTYKLLRSKIHHLTLASEQNNLNLLREIQGWLSYLNSVDKKRYIKAMKYIENLKLQYSLTIIMRIKSHLPSI